MKVEKSASQSKRVHIVANRTKALRTQNVSSFKKQHSNPNMIITFPIILDLAFSHSVSSYNFRPSVVPVISKPIKENGTFPDFAYGNLFLNALPSDVRNIKDYRKSSNKRRT